MNLEENNFEKYQGEGIYLLIENKRYIDCASGTFNLSLGYSEKSIINELKLQMDRCCHLPSQFTHERSRQVYKQMEPYLPEHIKSFWFRDIIGSTANECAVRIAQKYTGKFEVLSLFASHHGQSLLTTEISGNAFRKKNFSNNSSIGLKIPSYNCANCFYSQTKENCNLECALRMEDFIEYASSGSIAALIIEPVQGNGGNIVPKDGYFKIVRRICDKYNILIIADEVQTCFGRTGTFFASNGFAKDLKPDIITFAKGAGGIGIPVAGVLMRKELDILEKWEHSTTSGANPLALTAMSATINYIEKHNILENVNKCGNLLKAGLLKLSKKHFAVKNVTGLGLMCAFDLSNRKFVNKLLEIAYENGLIVRASRYDFGTAIKVRPPLIVTEEEIHLIIKILDKSLEQLEKWIHQINKEVK